MSFEPGWFKRDLVQACSRTTRERIKAERDEWAAKVDRGENVSAGELQLEMARAVYDLSAEVRDLKTRIEVLEARTR